MADGSDALDALRSALAGGKKGEDVLQSAGIRLLNGEGKEVDDVADAIDVKINGVTYPKEHATRLARSRTVPSLQTGAKGTPSTAPDDFFALDAMVFALQMASAQGGVYVVQATSKGLARFDAVERPDILAYLLGRRSEWDGVLSMHDLLERAQGQKADGVAGPSTTPPSSPPATLKELFGAARVPAKRAYVPSRSDAAFVKRLRTSGLEIVLQNRNDAMHGSHPWTRTADFSSFRLALAPTIEAARKLGGAGTKGSASNAVQSTSSSAPAQKRRAQDPIIMLSNSPTALINMFNVKRLLEEGVFVDPYEARSMAGGLAESVVAINHRSASSNAPSQQQATNVRSGRFLVVDNADSLQKLAGSAIGQDVWNRVVAVFTTGQMWQFKTYHWSEPRELFKHVMGVYVRWHNEPKNANVRDWPITELTIDRTKRHTDRQVVSHFWRNVDNFVARRKSHLL